MMRARASRRSSTRSCSCTVLGPSITRANSAHSQASPLVRCSTSRTAGMPSSVSGTAWPVDVTIQPKIVTGVASTISGANSITSATKPRKPVAANDAIPSGNLSATKTRLFHVTGSRSQRVTRSIERQVAAVGRLGDRDAEQAARQAALEPRHRAPGGERREQDAEADDHDRERDADRDPDHEHDEVREAGREREQHVGDVQPRLAAERRTDEAGQPGAHAADPSRGGRHRRCGGPEAPGVAVPTRRARAPRAGLAAARRRRR